MIYSNNFIKFITALEGNVPYPYFDNAGYKTVGIGCRVYNTAYDKYNKHNPMPNSLVESLFWTRAKEFINTVNETIRVKLLPYQYDALIALAFNIGITGFKTSTLAKEINNGKTGLSLMPFFEAWRLSTNVTTGQKFVNPTLVTRRKMEYHLFTTGEYLGYDLKPLDFSKKKYSNRV